MKSALRAISMHFFLSAADKQHPAGISPKTAACIV